MSNDASITRASEQVVDLSRPGSLSSGDVDPLAIIEQRNKLLDRVLEAAIKSTHPGQWKDLGGNPWPEGPAAEAMARRCAVSMTNISREKIQSQDDKGPFYIWVYRATFSLPGGRDVLEAEGTCSSRDSFLGTETSAGRPLSEIDEGSVMKAALTNCRVNGICQLLGVRRMSWERLGQLGLKRDQIGKVEYDQGARGGGRGKSDDEKPIPFGRSKGKKLGEAPDDDLTWLLGKMKEPASDPKFQASNDRWVKAIEAELARRANKAAGTTAAPAGATQPSLWQRIRALAPAMVEGELKELVKLVTKKTNAKDLVEADLAPIQAEIARRQAEQDENISF